MKVTFISFSFGEYSIRLVNGLSNYVDVQHFYQIDRTGDFSSLKAENINFVMLPKIRLREPIKQFFLISNIHKLIKEFSPDIIHIQNCHFWFNLSLPFLKNQKLIFTIHDPIQHQGDIETKILLPTLINDLCFKFGTQFIVHGKKLKEQLILDKKISPERIHVIPHIKLGDDVTENNYPEKKNSILFFGRIWRYKGLEYLIRAEPLISKIIPDLNIVIAGKGEDFSYYRKLITNPSKFQIYNEYISDSFRKQLFQETSLVILPYIDASQSGIIPLAYNYGKPVIATSVGALDEIVFDGETGFLIPPKNIEMLANSIITLLTDDELRKKMGKNAREFISNECSSSKIAEKTYAVYQNVLKN